MNNNKPAIFLDFDGLKSDTLNIHVEYINQKYNIQSVLSDYINNPSLELILKKYIPSDRHHLINREEIYVDIGENFNNSLNWHKNVPPIEGMTEVIPLLAEKYTLWTVTARQVVSLPVIDNSDIQKVLSLFGESFYTTDITREKREIRTSKKLVHSTRKRVR